jgi:hypothetical protein
VLLLESGGTLKGARIFSQEQGFKVWILGEREKLKLWISRRVFAFLSGPTTQGGGGCLFIVPTSKRVIGESFHRTSLVRHRTSLVKLSGSRSRPNLSNPPD